MWRLESQLKEAMGRDGTGRESHIAECKRPSSRCLLASGEDSELGHPFGQQPPQSPLIAVLSAQGEGRPLVARFTPLLESEVCWSVFP